MKVEFVAETGAAEIVALLVHEGRAFSGETAGYDAASSGALTRAMKASRFTGAPLSHLAVAAPAGLDAGQILLVGAGDKARLDDQAIEKAAAQAYSAVKMSGAEALTLDLKHLSAEQAARAACETAGLHGLCEGAGRCRVVSGGVARESAVRMDQNRDDLGGAGFGDELYFHGNELLAGFQSRSWV